MSQPGDNPNLSKAKRRGGFRPKTQNHEPQSRDHTLHWVDPLRTPVATTMEFTSAPENEYSGQFEVDYELPSVIAQPHIEALQGLIFRTTGDEALVPVLSMALHAQTYFKCARKLYATLPPFAQTNLQPLKGVLHDDVEVPVTVARLVDVIGNFDSDFGRFRHRYQITTFLRWVAHGLAISGELSGFAAPGAVDGDPLTWVWDEPDSLQLVLDLARQTMERLRAVSHVITIQDQEQAVMLASLPEYSPANYELSGLFPAAERELWRRVGLLSSVTSNHLRTRTTPLGTPPAVDLTTLLQSVGLSLAPANYSYGTMRNGFVLFQTAYSNRCARHMAAYFKMTAPPAGEVGYSGQLATGEGMTVHSELPLSQADMAVGFLLNPCRNLDFTPNVRAYSRTDRRAAMARVVDEQLADIAH